MWNKTLVTFLFELANFVVLAAILTWLFFKPIRKALNDQRERIQAREDAAAQALEQAEKLRDQIRSERKQLTDALEQMRKKTLEQAKAEASAVIDDARKHMDYERESLRQEAAGIQRAQMLKTAHAVAAAAEQAVARLLKQLSGPELRQMLIVAACNELASFTNNSLDTVTIESATELSTNERAQIETVLGRAKNKTHYRIVPELGDGLRISTGEGLIDTSVAGIARFAEDALAAELERELRDETA